MLKESKIFKIGLVGTILASTSVFYAPSILAAEEEEVIQSQTQILHKDNLTPNLIENDLSSQLDLLDPFVIVQDNQYQLELPNNSTFSQELINATMQQIEEANTTIKENNLTINPETKTAYMGSLLRAAGKNGIEFGWNYWRIFLSQDVVNAVIRAGAAGGVAIIVAAVPGISTIGAAGAGAVVSSFISDLWKSPVSNGVWFDFNTYLFTINNHGWQ